MDDKSITEWLTPSLGLSLTIVRDTGFKPELKDLAELLLVLQRIYSKALVSADIAGIRVNFDYLTEGSKARELVVSIKNEPTAQKEKLKAQIDEKLRTVASLTQSNTIKDLSIKTGINTKEDPIIVVNVTLE